MSRLKYIVSMVSCILCLNTVLFAQCTETAETTQKTNGAVTIQESPTQSQKKQKENTVKENTTHTSQAVPEENAAQEAVEEEIEVQTETSNNKYNFTIDENGLQSGDAYFTDEEFQKFFNTCKQRYADGEETIVYNILFLILQRSITLDQLHQILDAGYLTEYVSEFKSSHILEPDYSVPSDTPIHKTPELNRVTPEKSYSETYTTMEDPDKEYVHNLNELLSIDAQKVIVELLQDDVLGNAYIVCPESMSDKTMSGQMLEIAAFSPEILHIIFMSPDNNRALYTWEFARIMYLNRDPIDLNVEYNGKTLKFDLGDTLPKAASLLLYTGEPEGTTVNLKNHDGTIAYSLTVDKDGYIAIPNIYDRGDYRVSNEYVQKDTGPAEQTDEKKSSVIDVPVVSNVGILVIILILIAVGTIFAALAIAEKADRPTHVSRIRKPKK